MGANVGGMTQGMGGVTGQSLNLVRWKLLVVDLVENGVTVDIFNRPIVGDTGDTR